METAIIMDTIYERLTALTDEYEQWCNDNNLPADRTADELLYVSGGPPLSEDQKQWLINFIDRWKKAYQKNEHS